METKIKVIVEKAPRHLRCLSARRERRGRRPGRSYQAALDDVCSAIAFHVEVFGAPALVDDDSPVIEAFVAEASMAG